MDALRYNDGKVDYTLIPVEAETPEAQVWMYGLHKYGRDNWKKLWGKDTLNVALASLERHAKALKGGQLLDPESGLPHAAHIRCNAAMILYWMVHDPEGKLDTAFEEVMFNSFQGSLDFSSPTAAPVTDQKSAPAYSSLSPDYPS